MQSQFFSIHRQGFVRVAACVPTVAVGDPRANTEETLKLFREGDDKNVDLMVFPELGISAYAIDDLFLQDALLDGVEAGIARLVEESASRSPVIIVGAPIRRNGRLIATEPSTPTHQASGRAAHLHRGRSTDFRLIV